MANGIISYDGEIENDGVSFEVIPEGEYNFEVMSFSRKRGNFTFRDENKKNTPVPDCPYVEVALKLFDDDGRSIGGGISEKLYMHTAAEWKLCQFFTSIGLRKHGEKFRMDWNGAAHKTGRLEVVHNEKQSTRDASKNVIFANVKRFIDPPASNTANPDASGDDNPL